MTNTALQNVHMEEFIEEVRQRPAIYDTTKAEYCDRSLKRHLWMEICEKFNPDWQTLEEEQREAIGREMKNRWKSIRDAFVREVRYLKEAAKFGEPPAKKRKYIYYDQLSFLLPTVGSRSNTTVNKIHNFPPLHATTGHFLHNTSYDDSYSEEALDLKKEPQEPVTNLQEVDLQETQSESDRESSVFGGRINNLTQKSNNILRDELTNNKEDKINIWLNWNSKENNDPREPQEEKVEVVPIIDNMVTHQTSHDSEINNSSTNSVYDGYGITADSDYMFLMSLLPSFKKLGDETKSMIKIEIASVLHNAIYGPRRFSEQLLLQENVRRMVKTPNKKV